MTIIKLILSLIKWIIIIGIVVLGVYVISSNFNILGNYRPYLVQSGSMEPSIMTGDIVVIQSRNTYVINDVITFKKNSGQIVTHRIVSVEGEKEKQYFTKGDANRTGDEDIIINEQIVGKVVLVIPKLGYLVAFIKSGPGLIYLLIIPAIVFIFDELIKIKKNVKNRN